MNEHMTNSLVLVLLRRIPICDISDPLGHVYIAGDNQRTSNLFLMLSPETMELERVSGVHVENPMHGHQIKSAGSIRFVVDLCSSMLTYWQVACEDDLAACTDFRFVQHLHYLTALARLSSPLGSLQSSD